MFRREKSIFFSLLLACGGLFLATDPARAAILFITPGTTESTIGASFDVSVRVDSDGQGFNATQATLQFPKEMLSVSKVDYSAAASVFNFWLEEPAFSNEEGTVHFIGGTSSGVVAPAAPIVKITFKVIGSGDGALTISDAAVTASDGSGSNVLSSIKSARFSIKPTAGAPETIAPAVTSTTGTSPSQPTQPPTPPAEPTAPIQIVRTSTQASKLPALPVITIPAYPIHAGWSDITTEFFAKWDLPSDISGVVTAFNKEKNFTPSSRSEGLFEGKSFLAPADGVWYVHVRYKNNIGWGPTAHYQIGIDTIPPTAFTITSVEGAVTEYPKPTLNFKAADGLSGLDHYNIQIDGGDVHTQEGSSWTLPALTPGKHTVTVKAMDIAGNIRDASLELDITPITSPIIANVQKDVYVGEGNITISGTALPNTTQLLTLETPAGLSFAEQQVPSDDHGNWQAIFETSLKKGTYHIKVITEDKRGAQSLPILSEIVQVRERPLFVIGGTEITTAWFYLLTVIILLSGLAIGILARSRFLARAGKKTIIAQRDVANIFTATIKELNTSLIVLRKNELTEEEVANVVYRLKKTKDTLQKYEEYITKGIEEIPR